MADEELKIYADEKRTSVGKDGIDPYAKDQGSRPLTRDDVRDVLLSELRQFRSSIAAPWGGLGNSGPTVGGDLFGFFTKQPHGFFNQSPHQLQGTVDADTGIGQRVAGNDFGRIFVEELPDAGSDSPSWSFDLPAYSQKMLIKSTGPGLVYNTLTSAFTAGEKITGGTSGATAYVSMAFPDGATTNGTLYLYNVVGTFYDGTDGVHAAETISGNLGGSATITRNTHTRTNPIVRVYGVGGESADSAGSIFTFWGLVDLFAPIGLFNQPSSVNGTARDVEQIPAFENNGTMYVRNTAGTRAVRVYLNGSWQDFGGSGGGTSSVTRHTQNLTTTSSVTYAHGLGRVPTTVRVQAEQGGTFSDGTWDGTNQMGLAWGTDQAQTMNGYSVFITTSAGNIALGQITAADTTNVTISWADKVGAPSGTADLNIIAS